MNLLVMFWNEKNPFIQKSVYIKSIPFKNRSLFVVVPLLDVGRMGGGGPLAWSPHPLFILLLPWNINTHQTGPTHSVMSEHRKHKKIALQILSNSLFCSFSSRVKWVSDVRSGKPTRLIFPLIPSSYSHYRVQVHWSSYATIYTTSTSTLHFL